MEMRWRRLRAAVTVWGLVAGCALLHGCCVAQGTWIDTPGGPVAVEDVRVGDEVWSVGPEGTREPGRVTRAARYPALGCLRIDLADGSVLRVTGGHPLATRRGWMRADRLARGQDLRKPDGWVNVTDIRPEPGPLWVYDLSVSPRANFVAAGVVVHNKKPVPPIPPGELPGTYVGLSGGKWASPVRMELHADGTGLVAMGPHFLYRITGWTTGEPTGPGEYAFRARYSLIGVNCECDDCNGQVRGAVTAAGISFRFSSWTWGYDAFVQPEAQWRQADGQMQKAMAEYKAKEK